MAKNKPKINNTVVAPRYRVKHMKTYIVLILEGGSEFSLSNVHGDDEVYIYAAYKNNRFDCSYKLEDYTFISTEEEMFQNSLLCNVPMQFETIVKLQKALKHHFYQYLYPSKRELCNLKCNYIIDTSYALEEANGNG